MCVAIALLLSVSVPLTYIHAAEETGGGGDANEPPANKLTLGWYRSSSGVSAADINLRHSFESSTGWIATYRDSQGLDQYRLGWEYDWKGESVSVVPSLQAASKGFAGMSLYSEVGGDWFAILGFGRTNLRPYYNLNFDPNDAVQLGVGYRDAGGNTTSLYAIRDDRLGTGQTNVHLSWRRHLPESRRVSLDLVKKRGYGDDNVSVNTWSATLTLDWKSYFIRVAVDPNANYTVDRQTRVSGGFRF